MMGNCKQKNFFYQINQQANTHYTLDDMGSGGAPSVLNAGTYAENDGE
jgi:hypothetical protein